MTLSCIEFPEQLAALKFAESPALIDGDRRWSFARLEADVAALTAHLVDRYESEQRIVLFMSNRAEFLLLQMAADRAGLIRVPINARYTAYEASQILRDCTPVALFCDEITGDRAAEAVSDSALSCEVVDVSRHPGIVQGAPPSDATSTAGRGASPDAICSINYTSGTSGTPKGVVLTRRNWHAVTRNMLIDRDVSGSDVVAHVGPLTHASGTYFQPFLLRGACSVIVRPPDVETLLRTIERHRVTGFTCVPTVLTRIVNVPDIDAFDLSSLRWIGYGGEPIPGGTLRRAQEIFGPILTLNYGLTEAMMTCTTFRPPVTEAGEESRFLTCIGRPYSFVQVAIRAPDGTAVPCGSVGELTIKAEHVMQGYWNKPDETGRVLRDGWLWSGDMAWMSEDGLVHLAGRSKDMLISGGFNIYPAEVEAVVNLHPDVKESAVIGVPDADFGEIAVAIVASDSLGEAAGSSLKDFCRPKLGIKTPKKWIVTDVLPRTPNGKVDKSALREALDRSEQCGT